MWRSAPNALSLSRIVIALAVTLLYSNQSEPRFVGSILLLASALVTDILDGRLARHLNISGEKGYILDGLGDRAVYISLILAFVAQHRLSMFIAWLLIFREVAIYANRLLQIDWLAQNAGVRELSLWHAAGIRIWFLTYLVADGLMVFKGMDLFGVASFRFAQTSLVSGVIAVSYYSLFVSARITLARLPGSEKA